MLGRRENRRVVRLRDRPAEQAQRLATFRDVLFHVAEPVVRFREIAMPPGATLDRRQRRIGTRSGRPIDGRREHAVGLEIRSAVQRLFTGGFEILEGLVVDFGGGPVMSQQREVRRNLSGIASLEFDAHALVQVSTLLTGHHGVRALLRKTVTKHVRPGS